MAWTTPGTAVAGDVLTAAFWNEQVRDNSAAIREAQVNVVSTALTSATTISTSSASYSATFLETVITPSSAASKIFVILQLSIGNDNDIDNVGIRLMRGSTAIGVGDAAGSRTRNTIGIPGAWTSLSAKSVNVSYLDSPASTSAQTYGIQIYSTSGVPRTWYINRGATDTDSQATRRTISTLTLMEIPV